MRRFRRISSLSGGTYLYRLIFPPPARPVPSPNFQGLARSQWTLDSQIHTPFASFGTKTTQKMTATFAALLCACVRLRSHRQRSLWEDTTRLIPARGLSLYYRVKAAVPANGVGTLPNDGRFLRDPQ